MATIFFSKILNRLLDKEFRNRQIIFPSFTKKKEIFPCIAVSRECGSGGRLIATLVAKKLKMKYYDKELVKLIAKSFKKRKEVIKTLDERSRSIVEGIINSLTSSDNKLSESRYFRYFCQIILSLIQKNKAVFLGRGVNFIIPPEKCLAVRIVAPLKTRIENTVKYEKMSLAQAKTQIRRLHFARKDFVKRYFLKNISNANYYDLVINTQFLTLEQAVHLIIEAYKKKFP